MERSALSYDEFNWDNCRKYMNRDMTVEVYMCINDNLYWVIVDIQHFTYEVKRITPCGAAIFLRDILATIPNPDHPANSRSRGFQRVKYYLSYNPTTKTIQFKQFQKRKCNVANLEIEDEELISKIPTYIYELTRNTTPDEYLEHKSLFQSLVDAHYANNTRLYYSKRGKMRNEMVKIIEYYNDHPEEGWKMAVHAVTEYTQAEEIDQYEMPCMPAGVSLTPANYLALARQ